MAAEGRSKALWSHTACLLCLIANVNRGKKSKAFKPADFHPHVKRPPEEGVKKKVKMSEVKEILFRSAAPRRAARPRPRGG